jgi:hypothetical protein
VIEREDLNADPFDVASGDMEAVARRIEQFWDAQDDQSWLDRARADIAAGRTFPLEELGRRRDVG